MNILCISIFAGPGNFLAHHCSAGQRQLWRVSSHDDGAGIQLSSRPRLLKSWRLSLVGCGNIYIKSFQILVLYSIDIWSLTPQAWVPGLGTQFWPNQTTVCRGQRPDTSSSTFHFGRMTLNNKCQTNEKFMKSCSVSIRKKFKLAVQRCPRSQTSPRNLQTNNYRRQKKAWGRHGSPGVPADPRRPVRGRRRVWRRCPGGGGWPSPTRRWGTPAGGPGGPGPEQCY